MGILGNNSQTVLNQKIGTNRVTNSQPGTLSQSGYSDGAVPKKGSAREVPPDYDKVVKQPARKGKGGQGGRRLGSTTRRGGA
jgi:hypothetical protein